MLEAGGSCTISYLQKGIYIVYFYPKDSTPGCTIEAPDFSKLLPQFEKLGAKVFGVSKDDEQSHQKFTQECDLSVQLISDVDGKVCEDFGVIGEKINFGKTYIGIIRSTFIIKNGIILKVWKSVQVKDHAQKVLNELTKLLTK
jgi:peroxiredoxin Q/BCP